MASINANANASASANTTQKNRQEAIEKNNNQGLANSQMAEGAINPGSLGFDEDGPFGAKNRILDGSTGSYVYDPTQDILLGKDHMIYADTKKIEGTQMQYAVNEGMIKTVNFKQDYVVLVRKKLMYSANAQNFIHTNDENMNGQLGYGNYLRSYRLDNFTSININSTVSGSGNCTINLKGNERVMCFDETHLNDTSEGGKEGNGDSPEDTSAPKGDEVIQSDVSEVAKDIKNPDEPETDTKKSTEDAKPSSTEDNSSALTENTTASITPTTNNPSESIKNSSVGSSKEYKIPTVQPTVPGMSSTPKIQSTTNSKSSLSAQATSTINSLKTTRENALAKNDVASANRLNNLIKNLENREAIKTNTGLVFLPNTKASARVRYPNDPQKVAEAQQKAKQAQANAEQKVAKARSGDVKAPTKTTINTNTTNTTNTTPKTTEKTETNTNVPAQRDYSAKIPSKEKLKEMNEQKPVEEKKDEQNTDPNASANTEDNANQTENTETTKEEPQEQVKTTRIQQLLTAQSYSDDAEAIDWRMAEKCDFEPMDEIWIFGKSNFERDETGDFKYNQIFFGYIDSVTKRYQSGKGGLTLTIACADQLKILSLSYITNNPSLTPGMGTASGLDLRFARQDGKHFGTFELYNPYEVAQELGSSGTSDDITDEASMSLKTMWRNLALDNIFAGEPVCDIIKTLCLDAGVAPWFLIKRIEPIQFPPFTFKVKGSNSDALFTSTMSKRGDICKKAADKLMLEFFADEEGNIVLKCPNYALGVNSLTANNMGFEELDGGLLEKVKVFDVTPKYYIDSKDRKKQDKINGKETPENENGVDTPTQAGGEATAEQNDRKYQNLLDDISGVDAEKNKTAIPKAEKALNLKYDEYGNVQGLTNVPEYNKINGTEDLLERNSKQREQIKNYYDYGGKDPQTATTNKKQLVANAENTQAHVENNVMSKETNFTNANSSNTSSSRKYEGLLSQIDGTKEKQSTQAIKEAVNKMGLTFDSKGNVEGLTNVPDYNKINGAEDDLEKYAKQRAQIRNLYDYGYQDKEDSNAETPTTNSSENSGNSEQNAKPKKKQQDYEDLVHQYYEDSLSNLTDAMIPEIPQEMIIGFTMTDSDKEIFNMYSVTIEGDFGMYAEGNVSGANTLTQINRVFPDLSCMLKFGCRPQPSGVSFPYMGNRENAHLLGFMMTALSVAKRFSATLQMIEDSSIKVGNPIRFFTYDEHPTRGLTSVGDSSSVPSAYTALSKTDGSYNLGGVTQNILNNSQEGNATYDQTTNPDNAQKSENGINPPQPTNTVKTNPTGNDKPDSKTNIQTSKPEELNNRTSNNLTSTETKDKVPEDGWSQLPSDESEISSASYEKVQSSQYSGVKAVDMVEQTNAHSIYYVNSISRQISPNGHSTMTLSLSCGRMMGKNSVCDHMMLLFKTYYDVSIGYNNNLSLIEETKQKYLNSAIEYPEKNENGGDNYPVYWNNVQAHFGITTAIVKAKGEVQETEETAPELTEEQKKYSTETLASSGEMSAIHQEAKNYGWKYWTQEIKGSCYEVNPANQNQGKKEYDFTIYVYDNNDTHAIIMKPSEEDGQIQKIACITADYKAKCASLDKQLVLKAQTKSNKSVRYCHRMKPPEDKYKGDVSAPMKPPTKTELDDTQKKLAELRLAIVALNMHKITNSAEINDETMDSVLTDTYKTYTQADGTPITKPATDSEGKTVNDINPDFPNLIIPASLVLSNSASNVKKEEEQKQKEVESNTTPPENINDNPPETNPTEEKPESEEKKYTENDFKGYKHSKDANGNDVYTNTTQYDKDNSSTRTYVVDKEGHIKSMTQESFISGKNEDGKATTINQARTITYENGKCAGIKDSSTTVYNGKDGYKNTVNTSITYNSKGESTSFGSTQTKQLSNGTTQVNSYSGNISGIRDTDIKGYHSVQYNNAVSGNFLHSTINVSEGKLTLPPGATVTNMTHNTSGRPTGA